MAPSLSPPSPSPSPTRPDAITLRSPSPEFIPNSATTPSNPSGAALGIEPRYPAASLEGRSKFQRWSNESPVSSSSGGSQRAPRSFKEAVLLNVGSSSEVVKEADCGCTADLSRVTARPCQEGDGWQVVGRRRARRTVPRLSPPVDLRGRCFNCFSPSHFAAACRRPTRCFGCRGLGHRALECPIKSVEKKAVWKPLKQQGVRVPVWQRLSGMHGPRQPGRAAPDIMRKGSVWQRITPSQPACGVEPVPPLPMASGSGLVAPPVHGSRRKRRRATRRPALGTVSPALQQMSSGSVSAEVPAHLSALEQRVPATHEGLLDACLPARSMRSSCVLAFTTEMAREEAALRKALFVSVVGTRPEVQGVEVLEEVALSFGIDVAAMAIHQAMPEDFLLFLPDEDTVSRVHGGGRLFRGPRFNLHFKRWTRCAHASAANLPALVDVKIRGIPPHAWARSTAEHLLHGSCLISELHPATVEKSDLSSFMLRAWCFNPALLHRDMDLLIVEPGPVATEIRCLSYKISLEAFPVDFSAAGGGPSPSPIDGRQPSRRRRWPASRIPVATFEAPGSPSTGPAAFGPSREESRGAWGRRTDAVCFGCRDGGAVFGSTVIAGWCGSQGWRIRGVHGGD